MANINDMGIPGVGTGILQPKLKYRWSVTFAGLGGGTDAQPLSMQVVTFDRPKLSFDEVALHRYNSRAWVASKHNWEELALTVEDDITGTASQVIQNQLQVQQWLIGAQGPYLASAAEGSQYKFVTYLSMLDGNQEVLELWTMEGCWFKTVGYDQLDYSNGEAVKLSISMRFDNARQDILGFQGEAGFPAGTGGAGSALGPAGRLLSGDN
jgi:hypothetical protein